MDELEQRVRRALRQQGSTGDVTEVLATVHQGARRRRQRRTVALAAAAVVAVLGAGAALALPGDGDGRVVDPAKSMTPPPRPSEKPTSATERPVAQTGLGTTGFDVTSADEVWRVSAEMCGEQLCGRVTRTDGSGWDTLTDIEFDTATEAKRSGLPPVMLVRVADSGLDAWAFQEQLWSTHDGGASWQRVRLPGDDRRGTLMVQPLADQVFALEEDPVRLWRSPVSGDDWTEAPLPRGLDYAEQILTVGGTLVVQAYQNDRPVLLLSDDGAESWRRTDPPCGEVSPTLRTSGTALFAACSPSGGWPTAEYVGPMNVWRSTNGETWQVMAEVRVTGMVSATIPVDDDTVLMVTGEGSTLVSRDGQEEVDLDFGRDDHVLWGQFITSDRGYLLTYPPRRLLATMDGGRSWAGYD